MSNTHIFCTFFVIENIAYKSKSNQSSTSLGLSSQFAVDGLSCTYSSTRLPGKVMILLLSQVFQCIEYQPMQADKNVGFSARNSLYFESFYSQTNYHHFPCIHCCYFRASQSLGGKSLLAKQPKSFLCRLLGAQNQRLVKLR